MKPGIRYSIAGLILACAAPGQIVAPFGVVRGDFVRIDGTNARGNLQVRNTDGVVVSCGFDPKTYFERDNQRIVPSGISSGDRIELVADHMPGSEICYARTVHVIDATLPKRPNHRAGRETISPTEAFAPRGDLTFAGIITRVNPDSVVLKLRTGEVQRLLLRADTRYLKQGLRVDPSSLDVSTRVFIRAGRNIDGVIEAYQVIWGEIIGR